MNIKLRPPCILYKYMEFFVKYIQWLIPDCIVRFMLNQYLSYSSKNLETKDFLQKELRLVKQMKDMNSVTYDTKSANEQHYEVPTKFFLCHLGKKLKYSSCEWSEGVNTIEDAEVHTIQKYQQYLELDSLKSGDSILEIGNGWGSLCLTNAEKYPELQFFSFSNSETQIEYIKSQIEKRQLKNLTVWRQDIDEFIKSSDEMANKFSRVVSIECIEHCRNYQELFKGIAGLLKDDGFTFFQILGHSKYSYLMNNNSWMGRNFFTGGTIPSMHLFHHFNNDLIVDWMHVVNGKEYAKTLDAWLFRMYENKATVMHEFNNAYGANASNYYQGWRMFYLMSSESFASNDGKNYCVGYFKMKKR